MPIDLDIPEGAEDSIPDEIQEFDGLEEGANYLNEFQNLLQYLVDNHQSNTMRINGKEYEIQIDGEDGEGIINFKTE